MEVGTGGNLGLSREYHKKLFGPNAVFVIMCMFYYFADLSCPYNHGFEARKLFIPVLLAFISPLSFECVLVSAENVR